MPRAAATLSDLATPTLTIVGAPRSRRGDYSVARLIVKHGDAYHLKRATAKASGFLKSGVTPWVLHWRQSSTNEGSAPSSTRQFDLVVNNVGRLCGRQRQPCKHWDIARGFGVFQGNLCSASRTTDGYVPGQPGRTGLAG
jgi:hypothetical protein